MIEAGGWAGSANARSLGMVFRQQTDYRENEMMRIAKLFLLLVLMLGYLHGCDNGANMKGLLDTDQFAFVDSDLDPLLIRAGVCKSVTECDDNYDKYNTCVLKDSLSCDIYGISDKKMIMEILNSVVSKGIRIGKMTFWLHRHHETGFFEKPLVVFTDHTLDK
jgi:hypothetical protein